MNKTKTSYGIIIAVGLVCLITGGVIGAMVWGQGTVIDLTDLQKSSYENKVKSCEKNNIELYKSLENRDEELFENCINSVNKYTFLAVNNFCKEPVLEKLIDLNKTVNDLNFDCNCGGD